jgi:hypothetical protein
VIRLDFPPTLRLIDVERQLRVHEPYLGVTSGWSAQFRGSGLTLDLSRVEYADFTALAQVAQLVEGAVRHEIPVSVAAPLKFMSRAERHYLENLTSDKTSARREQGRLEARAARRKDTSTFMSHCGFFSALQPQHVPGAQDLVTLSHNDDIEVFAARGADTGDGLEPDSVLFMAENREDRIREIVPLRWLSSDEARQPAWEGEVARILALRAPILTTDDVDALVTIVLRELVENAASHAAQGASTASSPPGVLIGAIAMPVHMWNPAYIDDSESLEEYRSWLGRRDAPLIRLIVADSGLGICETLKAPPPTSNRIVLPELGRTLQESERCLLWSMSPWSNSGRIDEAERHHARGLASVRRVIRESAGTIILRADNAASGMVYPDGARRAVSRAGLPLVPGTLVEMLLAPRTLTSSGQESYDTSRAARAAAIVRPKWRDDGSLDKDYLLRPLADTSAISSGDRIRFLCVTSDIPADGMASARLLTEVLQVAEEVADHPALVVMLCLGQSAVEIEPRIRAFDDLRLQAGEVAGVPVMVIDRQGATRWLGVDRHQSIVLSALAREPAHAIGLDDLARRVSTSRAAVAARLQRMSSWVGFDSHKAWLRLSPEAADEAIQRRLLRRARALIGARNSKPSGEAFLTPTMALIRSPLEEEQLFADLGGEQIGGFVLGRHVSRLLKQDLRPDLSIAVVGRFPAQALESFRAALGVSTTAVIFSGEAGLYDDPEVPFIPGTGRIFLLTAALVTGERVRHAADDLVRSGAQPVGVACLLDGRPGGESLKVLGDSLRVYALVKSRMIVEGNDQVAKVIDPVQIPRGSRKLRHDLNYPVSRETILSWCEGVPGSILSGHIARHSRRHFYSFFDPGPLLSAESVRQSLGHVGRELIANWLNRTRAEREISSIVILHLEERNGISSDFAGLMASTIRDTEGMPHLREVLVLRQTLMGGRWVILPPEVDLEAGTAVLVVDWGAVTLSTIQGLMAAAGEIGAESILAIALTSQLSHAEEVTAKSIRAVTGMHTVLPDNKYGKKREPAGVTRAARSTPAEIHFMASFPVGFSSVWECLPCRYAHEYLSEAERGSSDVLSLHARKTADRLAPRDLAECRQGGPRDAFDMPISPQEAVQLLRLRGQIEEARLSTAARLVLKSEISRMGTAELDALVRLLTLEPRLLKRAPMRHRSLRSVLYSKIMARLEAIPEQGMEVDLKRQYVLIIRAIAKEAYVSHFRDWLVESLQRNETISIAHDLLLGIYTLVSRPYHKSLEDAVYAEIALSSALDDIRNDPVLMRETEALRIVATLMDLLARTRYTSLTAAATRSMQNAWASLREEYYIPVMDHTVDVRMLPVQAAVQVERIRRPEQWQSSLRAWQTTQDFLINRVLPLLPPIRDIILARLYQGSPEDIERWRVACSRDILIELQKITSLLVRFVDNPEYAVARRDEARRLVGWWQRFFFDKPKGTSQGSASGLLAALADCPCRVGDAVREGVARGAEIAEGIRRPVEAPVVRGELDLEVFCNESLLIEIIQHLFGNATDPRHAIDPTLAHPVSILIEVSATERDLDIRMLNDGTQVRGTGGRGIGNFDRHVRNYGGSLTGRTVQGQPPWTYEARLVLPRYRPVYPTFAADGEHKEA